MNRSISVERNCSGSTVDRNHFTTDSFCICITSHFSSCFNTNAIWKEEPNPQNSTGDCLPRNCSGSTVDRNHFTTDSFCICITSHFSSCFNTNAIWKEEPNPQNSTGDCLPTVPLAKPSATSLFAVILPTTKTSPSNVNRTELMVSLWQLFLLRDQLHVLLFRHQ
ncbi:hypothetical protein TNCV_4489191 [Trichonephila clavipes]|nr:hypothetical protein TNCV_4489191 [Trichonephila clavipes]